MSFFKVDYKDINEPKSFAPIPKGDYEAMISDVEIKTFKSGNRGLTLTHTIRNDVPQEAQKRRVFDNYVATEKSMRGFAYLAKATGMPEGVEFPDLETLLTKFAQHIKGKPILITIDHDDTRDKYIEVVKYVAPSKLTTAGSTNIPPIPTTPPPVTPQPPVTADGKMPWD